MYAINIADLTKFTEHLFVQLAVLPVLDRHNVVDAEPKNFDGMAVAIDTDSDRADAIVDILRNGLGQRPGIPKHELRIYQGKLGRKTWKRI